MSPEPAEIRLAELIDRRRADVVERLLQIEWAADPEHPRELVRGAEQVRARVQLFLDTLVGGLRTGDWEPFNGAIGARTSDLLRTGVVTADQLNDRAHFIAAVLIPLALEEPEPEALLSALFATLQVLSGRIVGVYNRGLVEESQRLDDLKTMFLRMTGHELRAPLGTIRGYASMLGEGDFGELAPAVVDAVRTMDTAAANGLAIIDRLGEVARLESGGEVLHRQSRPLDRLVLAAVEPLREAAGHRGVQLSVEAEAAEAALDPSEVEIAIRNLVGNALKYAADGGLVRVRAWRDGQDAWFEVSDRGPGITPEDAKHVFERYYRSLSTRQTGVAGSGLGLYIVRRIAELHGGEATVESRPGKGTTFRLRLPSRP